jgi:hypothetical protein
MPTYVVPQLNRLISFWGAGSPGLGSPPTVTNVPGQPYINSRSPAMTSPSKNDTAWVPEIILRLSRTVFVPVRGDLWQDQGAPANTYLVNFVETMHVGFPNEYLIAVSVRCDAFGNRFTGQLNP